MTATECRCNANDEMMQCNKQTNHTVKRKIHGRHLERRSRVVTWGSNLQELAVSAVGIGLRPVDLLYFLVEWDFSMVRLVLWQLKSAHLLLECRSCVVGLVVWPYILCHWFYSQYKWGAV